MTTSFSGYVSQVLPAQLAGSSTLEHLARRRSAPRL